MSLLSQASLVVVPSGYKEDVVYSVKPTDGSGDLTFTRASDGTRVNSQGLVERVPWNLLGYSEDFSNAAWVTNNSTKTTSQTDPNGGNTAVKIVSTANVNSGIYQLKTLTDTIYTASLWMKGEVGGEIVEYGDATNRATATLTTSWERYSFSAINATAFFIIYNKTSTTPIQTWYVAFAQYNEGSTAKPYFPTTDRLNVPRLDYSGGCPSLLLEPQRTNILPYSNYFAAADWVKINGSIAANQATSPEGIENASTFTENTSNGIHVLYDNILATFSTAHTLSAFVKPNGRSIVYLRMENALTGSGLGITYFNVSTGQILTDSSTSSTIEEYANGWYRLSITATTPAANSTLFAIGLADSDNSRSYTGDGTSGIYLYGAQLEAGSYPTSYIPTTSASVTRVADAAYKTGISSLIGQTEGTLFVEFIYSNASLSGNPSQYFSISDGTPNERIFIGEDSGTTGKINARVFDGNVLQVNFLSSFNMVLGQRYKAAIAYKANDFAFYVNGVQVGTSSSGTVPTMSQLQNNSGAGASQMYYPINQTLLFKTRLTNAELAALTTL